MTPIDRIRQRREMIKLSSELSRPKPKAQPFPRNATGLSLVAFTAAPLIYKAIVAPTVANISIYGLCTLLFGAGVYALFMGQRFTAIYDGKDVSRAPKVPLKLVGSALLALAAAGVTFYQGGSLAQAAVVVPAVLGMSVVTFGLDPWRPKGLDTVDDRQIHQLEKLAARVGQQVDRIKKSAGPLAVPEIMDAVAAFEAQTDALLCAVTDDPVRAGEVRKFFTVYLVGVADASERFAAVYRATGDQDSKKDFEELLQKFASVFGKKALDYASRGQEMLQIEIDVLEKYLAREPAAA